jgi:hypothetical protein
MEPPLSTRGPRASSRTLAHGRAGRIARILPPMHEPLSEEELAELEALTADATPARWVAHIEAEAPIGGESMIGLDGLADDFPPDMYVRHGSESAPAADIKFIAASRNYVPRLLAEVRRLRGHS